MTTKQDDLTKLIADVLEHDRRMADGPWSASSGGCGVRDKASEVARCWAYEHSEAEMLDARSNAAGIALYRTAAPQLATALRDALDREQAMQEALDEVWATNDGASVATVRAAYAIKLEGRRRDR